LSHTIPGTGGVDNKFDKMAVEGGSEGILYLFSASSSGCDRQGHTALASRV